MKCRNKIGSSPDYYRLLWTKKHTRKIVGITGKIEGSLGLGNSKKDY
jgi:hypothetical protein